MSNYSEEMAQQMIVSGNTPNKEKFSLLQGLGFYPKLATAIYGSNEKEFQKAMSQEANAAKKAYADIYIYKRGRQYSSDIEHYYRYQKGDLSKRSTHLTRKEFTDLYNFISDANQERYILNVGLTISWSMLGIRRHKEATGLLDKGFIKHLKSWHAYRIKTDPAVPDKSRETPLLWCYVHENSPQMDFHTHMMICIPEEIIPPFRHWVRNRIQKLSKVQPVPKKAVHISTPPSQPLKRQWIRFQYMCKGLDPREILRFEKYGCAIPLLALTQFHYRDPGLLDCKKKMGYTQRYNFFALYKKEYRNYDYVFNLEQYKSDFRKISGFCSALDQGIYDIRTLYPSTLDDMTKKLPQKYEQKKFL
ncbi:hypothetical protein NB643_01700 [Oxalobacter aliiformigenes]|uniref:Uncharacterized protein n=1 Tax=Oxalobacter aliiformigenes TaxID=2946593 RepID=A0ABY7JGF0_9BURK|nr:hypothetical protein [Oxalobacter aliiformigenes]WAV92991.1 hypothetical protein NB641_09420 [Oxalobacter aliiformigenes]WAV95506.1 hypothetical protein NB643_01700 [Oxalobacter aliiformigenes]WAV96698.1 hypothetical protein NB645_07680 [Oxalobacter aliiformigenes]